MASFVIETYGIWLCLGLKLVCFVAYGIVMGEKAFRWMPPPSGLCSKAVAKIKAWNECARLHLSAHRNNDPFERKVRQLAIEARLQRVRTLARIGIHCMMAVAVGSVIVYGWYDVAAFKDVTLAKSIFHRHRIVTITMGVVMCTYCWLFPERSGITTHHIFHALIFSRLCWRIWASGSVFEMVRIDQSETCVRFLGALLTGSPAMTLGLNIIYVGFRIYTYASLFDALSNLEKDVVAPMWGNPSQLALMEVFVCASIWLSSIVVENWNQSTARANLLAKTFAKGEETVKSMLVVMCDAVVSVDNHFVLNTPSSDFARFLLRCPPNNSYQGVSFLEFLEVSDRQRIQQQLTSSSVGAGTTLSLTATLLDGNGTALSAQMYCTCFIDVSDERAYVIGILEVRDHAYGAGTERQDVIIEVGDTDDNLQTLRGTGALRAALEPDRATCSSGQSADSGVTLLAVDHSHCEAFIDMGSNKWPIVSTSLRMRQFSGPQGGVKQHFVEWLRNDDFAFRMQEALDEFRADTSKRHEQVRLGEVAFQPPHARRAGLECEGHMVMDMAFIHQSENASCVPVCLRFLDLNVRRAPPRDGRAPPQRRRRPQREPEVGGSAGAVAATYGRPTQDASKTRDDD
eukprot:TRINITY_DN43535_c0_g1_i2.p1 TRINITY_DN43535_c0_g1~~TRINITY_DN43535_c0_g1_i2.p1  ORF type:complete len:628 (+),score=65.43 TRINITY_DN43535_c0_g1_i2:146-2029(+)